MSKCCIAKPFTAMKQMLQRIEALEKNTLVPPVGSIQIFANEVSPTVYYPGTTWERIPDVFLVGAGGKYSVGLTGGEAEHTLVEAEIPYLGGTIAFHGTGGGGSPVSGVYGCFQTALEEDVYSAPNTAEGAKSYSGVNFSFGSGHPHNNMPPYLAVSIWKRTA